MVGLGFIYLGNARGSVATVALNGAKNAGILAAKIIGTKARNFDKILKYNKVKDWVLKDKIN